VSGQTYFERNQEKIQRDRNRGCCAEPGPWGTVCTESPGHAYSHYDAQDDSSWQDDWREDGPEDESEPERTCTAEAVLRVVDGWDVETSEATQAALVDAIRDALGVTNHQNGSQ
jgi:hypothetical protein